MKEKTNFDLYLEEQLKDKDFAARFKKAGEDWDAALPRISQTVISSDLER